MEIVSVYTMYIVSYLNLVPNRVLVVQYQRIGPMRNAAVLVAGYALLDHPLAWIQLCEHVKSDSIKY